MTRPWFGDTRSREKQVKSVLKRDDYPETDSWASTSRTEIETSDVKEAKSLVEGSKDLGIDLKGLGEDAYPPVEEIDYQVVDKFKPTDRYSEVLVESIEMYPIGGEAAEAVVGAARRLFNSSEGGSYEKSMAKWTLEKARDRGYKEDIFEGMR